MFTSYAGSSFAARALLLLLKNSLDFGEVYSASTQVAKEESDESVYRKK
jgi:hypothetical protein